MSMVMTDDFLPQPLVIFKKGTQLKRNTCFRERHTCFGCETETGVFRIIVVFQDRSMFSHIIQKVSERAFYRCG